MKTDGKITCIRRLLLKRALGDNTMIVKGAKNSVPTVSPTHQVNGTSEKGRIPVNMNAEVATDADTKQPMGPAITKKEISLFEPRTVAGR